MKIVSAFFNLLFFLSLPLFAEEATPYYVSYFEKRGGVVRSLSAKVLGNEILLEKIRGSFPVEGTNNPPWYFTGLPFPENEILFQLEGLPVLYLKQEPKLLHQKTFLGKGLEEYEITLSLKVKEEIIPLSEIEIQTNETLRPFGIEEIAFEGKGRVLFWPENNCVLAETFYLKGNVIKKEGKEEWEIEWAKGGPL